MSRRSGWSMVEVLLVIGIVVLVIGLLLPALTRHRETGGTRSTSSNNLKQIALACHVYASAYGGHLPPLVDVGENSPTGAGLQSLFFNILPYVEADNVYRAFSRAQPGTYYAPDMGAAQMILKTYISPADQTAPSGTTTNISVALPTAPPAPFAQNFTGTYSTISYAANGLIPWNTGRIDKTFVDGNSNTIMFAERPQVCTSASGKVVYNLWGFGVYGPSTPAFGLLTPDTPAGFPSTDMIAPVLPLVEAYIPEPISIRIGRTNAATLTAASGAPFQVKVNRGCDPRMPGTPHAGGMLVGLADGSVRSVSPSISQWSFWAACTPDGQEQPQRDWTGGN